MPLALDDVQGQRALTDDQPMRWASPAALASVTALARRASAPCSLVSLRGVVACARALAASGAVWSPVMPPRMRLLAATTAAGLLPLSWSWPLMMVSSNDALPLVFEMVTSRPK